MTPSLNKFPYRANDLATRCEVVHYKPVADASGQAILAFRSAN